MENILNNIREGILIINKNGNIEFCNSTLLCKLGYSYEELYECYRNSPVENNENFFKLKNKKGIVIKLKGKITEVVWNNVECKCIIVENVDETGAESVVIYDNKYSDIYDVFNIMNNNNNENVLKSFKDGKDEILKNANSKCINIFIKDNLKNKYPIVLTKDNIDINDSTFINYYNALIENKVNSQLNSIYDFAYFIGQNQLLDNNLKYSVTYNIKFKNDVNAVVIVFLENLEKYNSIRNRNIYTCIIKQVDELIQINKLIKKVKLELSMRKKSGKEFQSFLLAAADVMTIMDFDGFFEKVKIGWRYYLGWDVEEILGRNWMDFVDEIDKERVYRMDNLERKIKEVTNVIINYRCKNGDYRILSWRFLYISETNKFIATATDVTEEKKALEERKRYEKTLELENIKNEFFANVSHEFKTPLNVILSTIQLINCKYKNIDNKSAEYIDIIKQNSYRLLRLANNLIDMSKIDTGFYKIHKVNCDIVPILENIVTASASYFNERGISIIFDTEFEEKVIACDPEKIERVLLNLISNSIKYAYKTGNIAVTLRAKDDYLLISVKDNGIGIVKEDMDDIFRSFQQVENMFTRKVEGSGIGLSLVKALVEMHGGKVWVNSTIGKGSEFIFTLPIKKIDEDNEYIFRKTYLHTTTELCDIEFADIV